MKEEGNNMIRIFCTKKLAAMLPEKPRNCTDEIPALDKWCVNLTTVYGRDTVVAMCADTRFAFILWGLSRDQFAKLPELVVDGIRKVFDSYGIRQEITNDYLSGTPVLCTGADRKDLGKLTRLSINVSRMRFGREPSGMLPMEYVNIINELPIDTSKDSQAAVYFPNDRMLEYLQKRYQMKPICRPAFELETSLDLWDCESCRTLLVPAEYTFADLHRVLQAAYEWKDYHLYEFRVGDERISMPLEYDDDEPDLYASEAVLSSKLEVGSVFNYLYDFGDSWEVSIYVASIRPDFDQPWPLCVSCDGPNPPEDVGGVPGFLDFVEAYNDPDHPDHEEMREWAGYWSSEPNIYSINSALKRKRTS